MLLVSSQRVGPWLFRIALVLTAFLVFGVMAKLLSIVTGLLGVTVAVKMPNTPGDGGPANRHEASTIHESIQTGLRSDSASASPKATPTCISYATYAGRKNQPLSHGKASLPFQRPVPECRKVVIPEVDAVVDDMRLQIRDPDLFRVFENAFPNTLDTAIAWKGFANDTSGTKTDEELTMITTGDINAMWLRDSANQLQSYKSLLAADESPDSLASLFRGAINLQARFINIAPHCNAFQAPPESALPTQVNGWADKDFVTPTYPRSGVFECKYELDSLAAFLQLSYDYHSRTKDTQFFGRFDWVDTVQTILSVTKALTVGTYAHDGSVIGPPYTFQRMTSTSSETLFNNGIGNPVKNGTGLIRSAFRPSDDSCTLQLFIPANMMFSSYLDRCSAIMESFNLTLAVEMTNFARDIKIGIEKYGKTSHPLYGEIYAYEVDGFGGNIAMDDANIPSLLSAPMLGYLARDDPVYLKTRSFILSQDNPYYMRGPVINAVGGPHVGPGMAWPMALIVQILTTDDDAEITESLRQLVNSTNGLGLIHETVSSHSASVWTRSWFSWANGLFGQMILDLNQRKPHLLRDISFQ